MENEKIVTEDVVEEHNGVYGGKWHIVSAEGFDLPEGLEYLKKADKSILGGVLWTYVPIIRISNLLLDEAFKNLEKLVKRYEHEKGVPDISSDLEIVNCSRGAHRLNPDFGDVMAFGVNDLKVHGCHLMLRDLGNVMSALRNDFTYDVIEFSGNTFDADDKDWKELDNIVKASDNISSIENLILTNNDFDIDAKNRLKKMFRYVGKLIL